VKKPLRIAPFRPYPFLWSGHSQTLAGAFVRRPAFRLSTQPHTVELSDGDRLILHDDASDTWSPGDPVALLVHGMCGSSSSSYMQRIAMRLTARGIRTFRLDLRGCGAGAGLSRLPYHAGRSDDLHDTAAFINGLAPGSPLLPVGFSLGGNILLKWLGEQSASMPYDIQQAMAVNPPLDLEACTNHVRVVARGFYDRHFARLLLRHARSTPHWHEATPLARARMLPRRITDFDELFTAPLSGYQSALAYYRDCSAAPLVEEIRVPTLILSSRNDPLIPPHILQQIRRPEWVDLHIAEGGGHLGYISRGGRDPDRYWMDWRVLERLTSRSERVLIS
jgi:uncharacterized protein